MPGPVLPPAGLRGAGAAVSCNRNARGGRSEWRVFCLLFGIVALEVAAIYLLFPLGRTGRMGGDREEYYRLAVNLQEHGRFSSAPAPPYEPAIERAPGYPVFLALVHLAAGRSPQAVRIVQFVL